MLRPDFDRGFFTFYWYFVAPASSRRFLFLRVLAAPASVFSVLRLCFSVPLRRLLPALSAVEGRTSLSHSQNLKLCSTKL
jgi:hypothetical protein